MHSLSDRICNWKGDSVAESSGSVMFFTDCNLALVSPKISTQEDSASY